MGELIAISILKICIIAGISTGFGLSAGFFVSALLIRKLRNEVHHRQTEGKKSIDIIMTEDQKNAIEGYLKDLK